MKTRLTKTQAAELLRAASVLPPAQRDQFLAAVDARLRSLPHRLNDDDVQSAIVAVLADSSITTTHCFMCDAQPKEPAMAPRKSIRIDMRTGREIEDDDGPLQPGQKIVVPLNMRDGASEMQRWVMADKAARLSSVVDATGGTAGLSRPGLRYARDQAAHDARERAYQDSKRELQDAWRTPVAAAPSIEPRATMTDAHSVPRTMTMDEAQRIRDRAWLESVKDLESAWNGPAR